MDKFRIGDKIQCLSNEYHSVRYNDIVTVVRFEGDDMWIKCPDKIHRHGYNSDDFKLVQQKSKRNLPDWF